MDRQAPAPHEPTIIDIGMVRLIARAIDGAERTELMTEVARLWRALAILRPSLSPAQAATMAEGLAQVRAIIVDELQRRGRRPSTSWDERADARRAAAR